MLSFTSCMPPSVDTPVLRPPSCLRDPAWEFVRQLMAKLNDPVSDSVRILLLGLYHAKQRPDLKTQLKGVYHLLRRLIPKRDRRFADCSDLDVLYVLPTTTPSSVLNLGAVISAQSMDPTRSVLVLPDGVETPPTGVPPEMPSETYRSLLGAIAYGERVSALGRAWTRVRRILEAAHELDPRVAAAMQPFGISLWERLFEAELCALACARALARWKPGCVVSTSDLFPLEHQMFVNAKLRGIPTFLLQHGIIVPKYFPFHADKFLVWGEPDLKTMVDLGAPSDSIVVLGMPSSDRLFDPEIRQPKRARIVRPLRILILSNIRPRGPEKPVSGLASFLKEVIPQYKEHKWTVRLHPTEDGQFYRSLGERVLESLKFSPATASLKEAVEEADICCTIASTAGLEAMLMQKPLLVFTADEWIRLEAWWPNYGGGNYISSPDQLAQYLRHMLEEDGFSQSRINEQNEFLARRYVNLGCAAKAVSEFIEQHAMNSEVKARGRAFSP